MELYFVQLYMKYFLQRIVASNQEIIQFELISEAFDAKNV